MTTLDPSHFPWKARDGDPTTGGAVHTSVRAPFASTSNGARYASSSDDVTSSEDEREDIDADDHAEHFARLRRHRHARKDKKRWVGSCWMQLLKEEESELMSNGGHVRRDHEDARAHGRIPTIPVPDVRFEQSYLMSIQRASLRPPSTSQADLRSSSHSAFIHSQPMQSSAHTEDDHSNDTTMTPSKLRKDKRRRVEESLALVDDPASRKGSPLDDLLHPSSDRLVSIQWSQIAYITVRDQVNVLLKFVVLRYTSCRA